VKPADRPVHPSRKEFLALAREHTLVPVCRTLAADLETPVSAFLRAAWQERECFLLESVEGGEQVGRYTFIGVSPYKRIVAHASQIDITEGKRTTRIEGDVFAVLREALGGHRPAGWGSVVVRRRRSGQSRLRCRARDRRASFADKV
jgi:anthranilate synthase component 1